MIRVIFGMVAAIAILCTTTEAKAFGKRCGIRNTGCSTSKSFSIGFGTGCANGNCNTGVSVGCANGNCNTGVSVGCANGNCSTGVVTGVSVGCANGNCNTGVVTGFSQCVGGECSVVPQSYGSYVKPVVSQTQETITINGTTYIRKK